MLSATSEYALRALTRLARLSPGQVLLGRQLAETTGIPPKYLSKIMLSLRHAGLVVATRGTGGGYTLLRPPDAIHLIDVVQVFDGRIGWPHCLLRADRECSDKNSCAAHAHWAKVGRGYLDFLENTTVSDLSGASAHHPRRAARKHS
jgi:Rrf2 family protein